MYTYPPSRRAFRPVPIALFVAIVVDQCWIAPLAPELSRAAGFSPGIVFLDCPVGLPFPCGLTTLVLFLPLSALLMRMHSAQGEDRSWRQIKRKLRVAVSALSLLPFSIIIGGIIYFFAYDHLPRHFRNAIDSFGINADIYSFLPGHERIHLRGSMLMLTCFFIGLYFCKRKIRKVFTSAVPELAVVRTMPVPTEDKTPDKEEPAYCTLETASFIAETAPAVKPAPAPRAVPKGVHVILPRASSY